MNPHFPMPLPRWLRRALFATAGMNIAVAVAFLPPGYGLRALMGLPASAPPIYLATIALFILLFGLGYLWCATTATADRLFLTLAAAGKMSFFLLLVGYWIAGELPLRAPLLGSADLFFALIFLKWLSRSRPTAS